MAQPDPHRHRDLAASAVALRARYEQTGDATALGKAISTLADAVRLAEHGEPMLAAMLAELGYVLRLEFERVRDVTAIDEAIAVGRRAAELCPSSSPQRAGILSYLAGSLLSASAVRKDPALVAEAVRDAREAVATTRQDDPLRAGRLGDLALALLAQRHVTGDQDARGEIVEMLREAIAGTGTDDPSRSWLLTNLGYALVLPGGNDLAGARLSEAVSVFEEAVAATPPEHANYGRSQYGLGTVLRMRWQHTHERALLDRAIDAVRAAVASVPADHGSARAWLSELAKLLAVRTSWWPRADLVEEAVAVYRRLLELDPENVTDRLGLAEALLARFASCTLDLRLVNEALDHVRVALGADMPDEQVRVLARSVEGECLEQLATAQQDLDLCEQAVDALRTVLRDFREPPGVEAGLWLRLSMALRTRHVLTGEGIQEAVEAARRAVALGEDALDTRHGSAQHALRLSTLANLLLRAADEDRADLDEAERVGRRAVRECPPDDLMRSRVLFEFSEILLARERRSGDPAELDEAIDLMREAEAVPVKVPEHTLHMSALASALIARYQRFADLRTLEEAIAVGRAAVDALPASNPERVNQLARLVGYLYEHYLRSAEESSITEAIETSRHLIAATPPNHPELGRRLANMALMLRARWFIDTGQPDDLRAALDVHRQAADALPDGHPVRGRALSNRSLALLDDYQETGREQSIVEAVDNARQAVAATPPGHPDRADTLGVLGHALGSLFERTGAIGHALEAIRVTQVATSITTAQPSKRFKNAELLGRLGATTDQWDVAAEGYREAVGLFPLLAPRNLHRMDLEHQVASAGRVASDAAASALWAGLDAEAFELLEQGRGVLLSRVLDSRDELAELRVKHPELAGEWEELRNELDATTGFGEIPPAAGTSGMPDSDRRHRLGRRRDQLLVRIRDVPGFVDFLRPASLAAMLPAAEAGPVVTINVSAWRCDALVLTGGETRIMRLPDLSTTELDERIPVFQEALVSTHSGDFAERATAQVVVRRTLSWLWDVVAGPVLEVLGYTAAPVEGAPWPRVWWSPTGLLNFLPLHAAGRFPGEPGEPVREDAAVLDRVVSSYTPTIRALSHARSRPAAPHQRLLAAAMPVTRGQHPLPYARAEVEDLAQQRGDVSLLIEEEATHDTVIAALRHSSWAHFACHAHSDPVSPSKSHLLLHDSPLSVIEISRLRLQDAELAYLSACSTARGSTRLADEAIHIASAFQLAGYRNVVGSLWSVADSTAAKVAKGFYHRLTSGLPPAVALHAVIRGLRDEEPLTPSAWAGYVHAGP